MKKRSEWTTSLDFIAGKRPFAFIKEVRDIISAFVGPVAQRAIPVTFDFFLLPLVSSPLPTNFGNRANFRLPVFGVFTRFGI